MASDMEELNLELMNYIKTLELAMTSKDTTISEQQQDINKYQKKLGSAIELAEGLSVKSDVSNKTFDDNLQKMNDLIDQKSSLQGQLLLIQKTRDGLNSRVSELEKEKNELATERDELLTSVDELHIALKDAASAEDLEKQQQVIAALKADLSSYSDMEDVMMELRTKVEIVTVENDQLRDSLSRLKDLGEDAQQEIFNANDNISELEDRLRSKDSQNTILQSQIDSMEQSLGNLKAKADKAATQSEKFQQKCDTLEEENKRLREEIARSKIESVKTDVEEENKRLEGEVKTLKNDLVAFRGREGDLKFEMESLKVVTKENERLLANAKREWATERALLASDKNAAETALASLRAEFDASAASYSEVLSLAQAQLQELVTATTESRHESRALSAGLMKLKAKVTRQVEFNLDADESLKRELLKVFSALGDRLDLANPAGEDEDERRRREGELATLQASKEALEGELAVCAAELRREKTRYEQSLSESNFSIIDLKREKRELSELLDKREERLREHLSEVEEGRSTIRQLEGDMEEAREAYKDLSRSAQEILAQAQQRDPNPPPPLPSDEESAALIEDLEATVREQENKIRAYQATVEGLQRNPQQQMRGGGVSPEVAALAEKLSSSQRQVHDLQRQKAELLEQMIEMASTQPPTDEEGAILPEGTTDLSVSSEDEEDEEDEEEGEDE